MRHTDFPVAQEIIRFFDMDSMAITSASTKVRKTYGAN
ncbi:unnamed protein product [Ciceribacter selenitireducens ATCC BAA-1503]|uniref:Uncharacterized protein n=1 Tax=Ciceribacter selenitireducens ATCC BAA-1503 TaxID=1336235 RepID=A0A376ABE6_9HYPH|nr:unnamed protein product [Ciceribacter selenitireducens ATCC BAA-1503]